MASPHDGKIASHPEMAAPKMVTMEHVQNVATVAGFNWGTVWNIVQKLSPQLQQIVMTIIEELAKQPALATTNIVNAEGTPTWHISHAEASEIATANGFEITDLMKFFEMVGPILARIIAAFFKANIPPAPTPVPGPNPNPMPTV